MEYQRLGASGLEVSPLCIGTMNFGDVTDAAEARRIVDHAHAAGVNFIDTADVYAKCESEKIVGAAIAANRRHWILATKVGNAVTRKPHDGGLSRRWVLQACDDSLARLATDYIDIYYLHRDDLVTPIAETVGAIGDLISERPDPLLRRVELPRLAHRRGGERMRGAGRAAAGRLPALLQPAEPDAGGRDPARVRPLRHRRRALFADRARRDDGQVRGGRRAHGLARRTQGRADTGNGIPRGVAGDRAEADGARREDRPHADAVRARVAVGEPHRDVGDRRPAHARAMEGLRRGDRHAVEPPRTRRSSISLVRPGHPSTPGYSDPQYPFYGRVLE